MTAYLDTPHGTALNALYWIREPLEAAEVVLLGLIDSGMQPDHEGDRFWVAHLIVRECLTFDGRQVHLTNKGRDGLAFAGRPAGAES